MRRLNILTWHTHGSYLYYLSRAPHEFHVPARRAAAAMRAWPNASARHACKWGLLGLSHALHAGLRPHGMRPRSCWTVFPNPIPGCRGIRRTSPRPSSASFCCRASAVPELTVLPMRQTSWPCAQPS